MVQAIVTLLSGACAGRDPAYNTWKSIEPRLASSLQNVRDVYRHLVLFDEHVDLLHSGVEAGICAVVIVVMSHKVSYCNSYVLNLTQGASTILFELLTLFLMISALC